MTNNICIDDFLADDSIQNKERRIIIVLESPHVNEFEIGGNPIPAIGATGYALENKFSEIFDNYLKSKDSDIRFDDGYYHVFIMNAIEYQCSLGFSTSRYRDIVFKSLWEQNEIIDSFSSRLSKYNPIITISLCTKGNKTNFKKIALDSFDYCKDKKLTMRNMVINEIVSNSDLNQEHKIIRGCHPSSWNRRKAFRKFQKI
ncbi:hypothetical protein [Acetobacterium woodii]|uniref:Uncharacterized protein n=1 Tax=Acetobacterium woodii (strain ATCC 29683 / DSM 1030 / JCM 2381 / KCTC 1655 / WB1) TaxID=931626 RepID=H6LDU7_ACEWD|nr:hypothetical protein [Acetobacterium woodii]AFA47990.1 hypothetical protein Awo_c12060 [Acetobacterium woodii DSM 1030]